MHPVTYEVKRAHWRSMWEAIALFRDAGDRWGDTTLADMTPARFDVLQTIWDFKAEERGVREQGGGPWEERCAPLAWIRRCLGFAGSTIWKMAQKLAELLWIRIVPHPYRARQKLVLLTDLGIHALRMAQECAREDSIDERGRAHRGFALRAGDLVARDAVEQGALPTVDAVIPDEDAPTRTALGRRRPIRSIVDYLWWLVDRARGVAKFFGCKAWRLYHRHAYGQIVPAYADVVQPLELDCPESGELPDDDEPPEEETWEPPRE